MSSIQTLQLIKEDMDKLKRDNPFEDMKYELAKLRRDNSMEDIRKYVKELSKEMKTWQKRFSIKLPNIKFLN